MVVGLEFEGRLVNAPPPSPSKITQLYFLPCPLWHVTCHA